MFIVEHTEIKRHDGGTLYHIKEYNEEKQSIFYFCFLLSVSGSFRANEVKNQESKDLIVHIVSSIFIFERFRPFGFI